MRIAAQSAISLVLAPLAAASLVPFIASLQTAQLALAELAAAPLVRSLHGHLPSAAAGLLSNPAVAVTATAALLVSQCVPFTLSLIDEYYSLRSTRTAARALRAARSRRLELRKEQDRDKCLEQ